MRQRIRLTAVLLAIALSGCASVGPTQLDQDQVGYSRALGEAEKSTTLLNIVRIRYGDTPTFLEATQVISGYQLQRNVTGGFEVFPSAALSTFLDGGASVQLQQSPTFTFQPLSGEQFAQSFIRPLAPGDLLPLTQGGLPIDVLFRLGAQSINGLSNAVALTRNGAAGSADFFLLLGDLRELQIAGLLGIRLEHNAAPVGSHGPSDPGGVYLSITLPHDPALLATALEAKRLLGISPAAGEAQVIYGREGSPGQIAILTRSMLGVMSQLAIQIDVPSADIAEGLTQPTVGNIGSEHRPIVIIHSGRAPPSDAFAAIQYHQNWFWIAANDFDSKLAYTVLQILLALARTDAPPGTIVTIPAG